MKFKLSISCNFVGCDEDVFIECDEPPTDEELHMYADEWAGVEYEIEEMPEDDDEEIYEDWN